MPVAASVMPVMMMKTRTSVDSNSDRGRRIVISVRIWRRNSDAAGQRDRGESGNKQSFHEFSVHSKWLHSDSLMLLPCSEKCKNL
jgi:hypothetical protein